MSVIKAIRLKEMERVVAVIRHYPVVYAPKVIAALAVFAVPFFFMVPLFKLQPFGFPLGLIIFALFVLAGIYYAARTFIVWYWNVFIVTNLRIIDIDQAGLFEREVTEASYDKVQDVSYQVKGIGATLLGYGTVVVQTAGTIGNLELPFVHDPKEIHHLITETMTASVNEDDAAGGASRPTDLIEAAAGMNRAEARAFMVELQEAVTRQDQDQKESVDADGVTELMNDSEAADAASHGQST